MFVWNGNRLDFYENFCRINSDFLKNEFKNHILRNFIILKAPNPDKNHLIPDELTINQTNCNVVDGIDLDEIKEFAKAFKLRRLSLGLTQTQVGQALSVTEGPAYSQSAICR